MKPPLTPQESLQAEGNKPKLTIHRWTWKDSASKFSSKPNPEIPSLSYFQTQILDTMLSEIKKKSGIRRDLVFVYVLLFTFVNTAAFLISYIALQYKKRTLGSIILL